MMQAELADCLQQVKNHWLCVVTINNDAPPHTHTHTYYTRTTYTMNVSCLCVYGGSVNTSILFVYWVHDRNLHEPVTTHHSSSCINEHYDRLALSHPLTSPAVITYSESMKAGSVRGWELVTDCDYRVCVILKYAVPSYAIACGRLVRFWPNHFFVD